MRPDDSRPGADPPDDPALQRLRGLPDDPVPPDLLGRCLGTIPANRAVPGPSRRSWLRAAVLTTAAAAAAATAWVVVRPGEASAATLLDAAGVTWGDVAACRLTSTVRRGGVARTEDVWFVRGKGGRRETRVQGELVGVVVGDARWVYRWDVRGALVAAWPPGMVADGGFEPEGRLLPIEAMLDWARRHKGEPKTEDATLDDGRPARKVVVRWPAAPGGPEQTDVVWFDAASLRPVKGRSDGLDAESEWTVSYPDPADVPADLLTFRIPPGATLEVNDPAFGRPAYADPRPAAKE